jgi:hypothetical protein
MVFEEYELEPAGDRPSWGAMRTATCRLLAARNAPRRCRRCRTYRSGRGLRNADLDNALSPALVNSRLDAVECLGSAACGKRSVHRLIGR